jgi:hypothetical protein
LEPHNDTPDPVAEAHPSSINGGLADHLSASREEILREWMHRARSDAQVAAADSLGVAELKDHLPHILEDLITSLRRYGSEVVAEKSVRDAEEHGATRWRQGYDLPEVLVELMHFRAVLIYHLRVFEDNNPDFGMISRLFVSSTMHRFLDQMGIDATEEFLSLQNASAKISGKQKLRKKNGRVSPHGV